MDINIAGPINQLGYGIVTLNIVKALTELGNRVSLFPIGQPDAPAEYHGLLRQCMTNAQLFSPTAPSLRIWHQNDLAYRIGYGPHCVFPIFELDSFNNVERHHLSNADIIFVCTEWAKGIIKKTIHHPDVYVIPLGVDTDIFKPQPTPTTKNNETVFVNIGKWEVRKGHDVLIEAFNKAFGVDDNVKLIMHCFNPFNFDGIDENATWNTLYKGSPLGNKINISYNRLYTQTEVWQLIWQAHCGVFPSRGEGWNLELLECMVCGKMVICTDYSGHTGFANHNNSLLIPIGETEEAYDGKWFSPERHTVGDWASIGKQEIDILVRHMQNVHKLVQASKYKINNAGINTASQLTWKNTAKKIMEVFI